MNSTGEKKTKELELELVFEFETVTDIGQALLDQLAHVRSEFLIEWKLLLFVQRISHGNIKI